MDEVIEELESIKNIESKFHKPNEEEIEEAKRMMKNKDVRFIERIMREKVNKWKDQNLHCGITGSSGSGKSSFINAIRNLKGQDVGAAAVGVTETTKVPTPYKDPKNPKVVYWDLPGVGTEKFPKDKTYLENVGFEKKDWNCDQLLADTSTCNSQLQANIQQLINGTIVVSRYDFFLIISCTRFTENDVWLANQIGNAGKRFYFIRTKLDDDLRNEKREYKNSYNEEDVRKKIKNDCIDRLKKQGLSDPQVYLISNPYPEIPDFPNLVIELTKSLPLHKREAMTFSIHAFSKEIILEKKKILKARTYRLSYISAMGATVPLPGLSLAADITIILTELSHYREQFGLGDEYLIKYNLADEKIEFIKTLSNKEIVIELFDKFAASLLMEEVTRFIPFVGSIIASSASFYTTYTMLNLLLNKMANASLEIMEKRFKDMVKDMEMD